MQMTIASFVLEIDRTDPDYGRPVGFAARLENLLARPKVQADDNLPDALSEGSHRRSSKKSVGRRAAAQAGLRVAECEHWEGAH